MEAPRLAALALRPVPSALLQRAAGRRSGIGRFARHGLTGRVSTIAEGVAGGLRIDPGPSNPDYAMGLSELSVQQLVARTVRPGMVVYDVGANIGFFTLIFAHLTGPGGMVYAFEADLDNAATTRANAARNDFEHVVVVARACGAAEGFATLHLAPVAGGHSTVATGQPELDVGAVTVEQTTIDRFAATGGVRPPDLVKIDVEGAEELVLDGMAGTISRHRPILLIELDDADRAAHDERATALTARLTASGYTVDRVPDAYPGVDWVVSHWIARPQPEAAAPPAPVEVIEPSVEVSGAPVPSPPSDPAAAPPVSRRIAPPKQP